MFSGSVACLWAMLKLKYQHENAPSVGSQREKSSRAVNIPIRSCYCLLQARSKEADTAVTYAPSRNVSMKLARVFQSVNSRSLWPDAAPPSFMTMNLTICSWK